MNSQEYFDESVEYLKKMIEIRNQQMMDFDKIFRNKGAKSQEDVMRIVKEGKLSDDELDGYYNTSQLQVDVDILARKLCDFVYFNRLIGIEINIDSLNEIHEFVYFMKEYTPYKTTFILTPENTTKESNLEEYNNGKESFKKAIGNKNIINFIDENRN